MYTKPLLILAFNRPNHVKRLIDSLRPHQPQKILISVDGPRLNNLGDFEKISQVLDELKKIDWTEDIEYRIRQTNLGLRFAVADAVSWVIAKYGEVIVVEDDIEVGPEFLKFMSDMLDKFRDDDSIGHISGYNLVPQHFLKSPDQMFRISRIPESYAWATWSRAWNLYDPSLAWANSQSIRQLSQFLGGTLVGTIWKINFNDAKFDTINTWAYRWVASLWSNQLLCVSPNRNLVAYTGQAEGTHTLQKIKTPEIKVQPLAGLLPNFIFDLGADHWIQKNVFHGSFFGVARRYLESIVLRFMKFWSALD